MEKNIQTERGHLRSFLEHPNTDMETMITKVNEAQKKQNLDTGSIATGQEYNFEEQTESLMRNLHSVFSNEELITGRVLKKKATDVPESRTFTKVVCYGSQLVGNINDDIVSYKFEDGMCKLCHKCDWSDVCSRNDVQGDPLAWPRYIDIIEEMKKFYFSQ